MNEYKTRKSMYQNLKTSIEEIAQKVIVDNNRKEVLDDFSNLIVREILSQTKCNLNFICTHNSRRSHLSQIWAWVMSRHFNLNSVECFSGGTEATALFPLVQQVLVEKGIHSEVIGHKKADNPIYYFKISEGILPLIGFSKKYDDTYNPAQDYIAVMTCSHANENCPLVLGAKSRIALTYEDPKAFDHTPVQLAKYRERSHEIAVEMYVVFKQVSELIHSK